MLMTKARVTAEASSRRSISYTSRSTSLPCLQHRVQSNHRPVSQSRAVPRRRPSFCPRSRSLHPHRGRRLRDQQPVPPRRPEDHHHQPAIEERRRCLGAGRDPSRRPHGKRGHQSRQRHPLLLSRQRDIPTRTHAHDRHTTLPDPRANQQLPRPAFQQPQRRDHRPRRQHLVHRPRLRLRTRHLSKARVTEPRIPVRSLEWRYSSSRRRLWETKRSGLFARRGDSVCHRHGLDSWRWQHGRYACFEHVSVGIGD